MHGAQHFYVYKNGLSPGDKIVLHFAAEGGDTLSAYAAAAAQAFAEGGSTADAWVKAWAAAIAQFGCDKVKPALAGKATLQMPGILIAAQQVLSSGEYRCVHV